MKLTRCCEYDHDALSRAALRRLGGLPDHFGDLNGSTARWVCDRRDWLRTLPNGCIKYAFAAWIDHVERRVIEAGKEQELERAIQIITKQLPSPCP